MSKKLLKMMKREMMVVVVIMLQLLLLADAKALDLPKLRRVAATNNVTCILVFGDSTVDPGNNNRLPTTFKGNFAPYGKDFLQGRPTGRFTNGKLPTDIIAEDMGIKRTIPAFLDLDLKTEELLHGVSFASAATGYDDLTANFSNVLPFSKQIEYLLHYKIHLRGLVGQKREEEIVRNAIFILSASTNDFIQNYFLLDTRSKQFTVEEYLDYLITCMANDITEMHRLGGRRFAVVGTPPLGCLPLVKTLMGSTDCVYNYNKAAISFNSKLRSKLAELKGSLGVKTAYVDVYRSLMNAMKSPMKYGFTVTTKGCCGTGTIEYGDTCKDQGTCEDPTKYIYWDAVHPTETMYRIIAEDALRSVVNEILA